MKTKSHITGVQIGNLVFELDEACAAMRLTEDEHKFSVDSIVAAWEAQLATNKDRIIKVK